MGLDADILERIKKSLTVCLQQIEDNAIMLIDAKGKSWLNRCQGKIEMSGFWQSRNVRFSSGRHHWSFALPPHLPE